ncbi:hypothetical protein [Nocardia sp. NPDC057227]|uniref:hypothetical protein n=1 Tax=Nocardia sp. NPDC057227 TaxID=3346056 RepID=UPI0036407D7A
MTGPQKYRDRQTGSLVDAMQSTGDNTLELCRWIPEDRQRIVDNAGMPAQYLTTSNGSERVWLFDWVVRDSHGRWHRFKQGAFASQFRPVVETHYRVVGTDAWGISHITPSPSASAARRSVEDLNGWAADQGHPQSWRAETAEVEWKPLEAKR